MARLVCNLLRTVPRFLNRFFNLCWLLPRKVADDERIVRAIYSPYHIDPVKNPLKAAAYSPTPKTDEISVMRMEFMGADLCKRKAVSFENPAKKKEYRGFTVLRVGAIRNAAMNVTDSRKWFCGHADINLLIAELRDIEPQEPPPAAVGERLKKLKEALLAASNYVPDPERKALGWHGRDLEPPSN